MPRQPHDDEAKTLKTQVTQLLGLQGARAVVLAEPVELDEDTSTATRKSARAKTPPVSSRIGCCGSKAIP
ncbi:hypothetical protein FA951_08430 [Dermacoccus nishinomiyaensis]|uniref:hypothetical protein n=1 Tax=Dermacoccus TaxID=57495 RepID=UPI0007816F2F|nr:MULTISPECIES: hypothetical protein [Dermacoccus]MCT1604600.1 hypothetical protein [Dermacoccus nishinomiyaensis]TJZ96408.1 hypothetical protein FA951_08430 [Dermacoccus nishinomiyaensis]